MKTDISANTNILVTAFDSNTEKTTSRAMRWATVESVLRQVGASELQIVGMAAALGEGRRQSVDAPAGILLTFSAM